MTYDFNNIDALFFFDLPVSSTGTIADTRGWPEAWSDLTTAASAAATPIHVTVSVLDPDTFRSVFGSEVARATLLEEVSALALDEHAAGIHLDVEVFEPVDAALRAAFTDFVVSLREVLDVARPDAVLSLFLTAQDPTDAYDERALSAAADFVVIQGYDLHWLTGDTAGPVAPLRGWGDRNWEVVLSRFDALGVERRKMVFSVPYYGYEWPTEGPEAGARTTGPGRLTTYAPALAGVPSARDRARSFGTLRDEISGSPWYRVEDSTGWSQGWFEDPVSLAEKYHFLSTQGTGGVAVFPLAYGDEVLAATLESSRRPQ